LHYVVGIFTWVGNGHPGRADGNSHEAELVHESFFRQIEAETGPT
jgi:hypothetical protein